VGGQRVLTGEERVEVFSIHWPSVKKKTFRGGPRLQLGARGLEML